MCPPHYTYVTSAETCYMADNESLDWASAGKKCQQLSKGASLAAIESSNENEAVKAVALIWISCFIAAYYWQQRLKESEQQPWSDEDGKSRIETKRRGA